SDMQLEQLGNDALLMMDTQDTYDGENTLSDILKTNNKTGFDILFTGYLKKSTGSTPFVDSLRYNSTVYPTDSLGNLIDPVPFIGNSDNPRRSPAIRCGRYVTTDWGGTGIPKIIRLEVLIWRD
ncbi:MAG: hypothetical protein PHV39_06285, partial [Methanomicrobium sp.]|nr:hypothetical protein [Methanomicrobium sp.]